MQAGIKFREILIARKLSTSFLQFLKYLRLSSDKREIDTVSTHFALEFLLWSKTPYFDQKMDLVQNCKKNSEITEEVNNLM